MANCVDFNRKYKFKLSHSNDIDSYASIIDEEIESYFSTLNEKECNEPKEIVLTKKDLIGKLDLSSFKPQKELNPKIWVKGLLNSRVRLRLLDIADDFISRLPINHSLVDDIILTGSLANYNWSRYSDFDLHILIDFKSVDKRIEFVKDYFDTKKKEWNSDHENLKIYGFPVEIYVQDTNEVHTASGIYSIEKNQWIVKPEKNSIKAIKLDKFFIKSKTLKLINVISSLEDEIEHTDDDEKLRILSKKVKNVFDKIKGSRKDGLKKSGEMNPYNIIYKLLRRLGYISILLDLKAKTYDKINSIE